ncbi:GumC family protein [Thermodesulfobacteriota bacterium]
MNAPAPIRLSFRDFLTVIFKRKYQIALFFAITVGTIVGITYSTEPTYRTTAQILVKIGNRDIYALSGSTGERITNFARTSQISTEKEFFKSHFLAEKVLAHLGPENIYPEDKSSDGDSRSFKQVFMQHPIIERLKNGIFQDSTIQSNQNSDTQPSAYQEKAIRLQSNLSVRDITNTNLIRLSFKHNDPEVAASVLNTYLDIYLEERLQFQRNPQASTFFKDQSLELKNRLDEAEHNLELFKSENNITDLQQQQRIILQQVSDLRIALNSTLSEEIETKSRIVLLEKQLSQTPETIPQEEQTDQNEALISRLEAKLVDLQIEEKELLSKYTPQSRMVKNVRERINIVENKIEEQENKLIQRSRVGVNATYQRLKEELYRNQAEIEALSVKKEMLVKQLADFQSEKEILNRLETTLNGLQQSVELYRGNYKLYLAKMEASRIEDAMDNEKINDVISIDRAIPPLKPISPKYKLNIFLSILIGTAGGLLWAIIGDFMDDSIETPEDVEKTLQLTVLTSIPNTATRKRLDHRKLETSQSDLRIQPT